MEEEERFTEIVPGLSWTTPTLVMGKYKRGIYSAKFSLKIWKKTFSEFELPPL